MELFNKHALNIMTIYPKPLTGFPAWNIQRRAELRLVGLWDMCCLFKQQPLVHYIVYIMSI